MRAPLPALLLALPALAACVDGKSSADDSADTGAAAGDPLLDPTLDECVAVAPESLTGTLEGTIAHAGSITEELTAPADRLKGVVQLQLTDPRSNDDLVLMGVSLQHPDMGIDDTELDKDPTAPVAVMAALSPGETLTLQISEWSYSEGAPDSYAVRADWTWTETDDCYEPNDAASEAKHVPTGAAHAAWMIQGLGPDDDLQDWYRFTITEDSTVSLTLAFPATVPMGFALYAGDRSDAAEVTSALYSETPGSLVWTSEAPLAAGTYTLKLEPFVSLAEVDYPYALTQTHLVEGYSFQIDATPAG